jgi:hypothetical protein
MTEGGNGGTPPTKVARLIEEHDLGKEFGRRLERRWTGDGVERRSLRDLADVMNRRLLERALERAGTSTLEGEVSNLYRLLTDESVSSGVRTETRTRLEREGVDVDRLERDFVSYQAIRTYLRDHRGVEHESPSDEARVESVEETIRRLRTRIRRVTERSLDQLRETDRLTLGSFRLFVEVDVLCEECGGRYDVVGLLSRGGCDCSNR